MIHQASRGLILTSFCFYLSGCTGPHPVIQSSEMKLLDSENSRYAVSVVVKNNSRGSGQIEIQASLRNANTGVTYKESRKLALKPHETTAIVLLITAPIANYKPEVEVEYPVQ